eukprot:443298_1
MQIGKFNQIYVPASDIGTLVGFLDTVPETTSRSSAPISKSPISRPKPADSVVYKSEHVLCFPKTDTTPNNFQRSIKPNHFQISRLHNVGPNNCDEHGIVRDEHGIVRDEHGIVRDEHGIVRDEHGIDCYQHGIDSDT